jgi:hypothetical protein
MDRVVTMRDAKDPCIVAARRASRQWKRADSTRSEPLRPGFARPGSPDSDRAIRRAPGSMLASALATASRRSGPASMMVPMTFPSNRWPRVGAAASLAAWLAAAIMLHASPAAACSCAGPSEADVALANADVVFEGTPRAMRVMEADLGFPGYRGAKRFDFEVARYFKGQLGPNLAVFTIDQESACGREYTLDAPHVIYARYSDSGLLTDFLCSHSQPSSFASADLALLGSGVAPDPAIVSEEDELEGTAEAADVASGIRHLPLDADPEARGCGSSLAPPSAPSRGSGLAVASGLALLAWRLRRRSTR